MTKKYSLGFVGRKAGMSRVFTDDGRSIPVTLIEATPNRITQVKTVETDGYSALQVTAGVKRASLLSKPAAGHLAKAKVEAGRGLWELRVEADQIGGYEVGGEIKADIFSEGQIVDVQGVTKGKGFQGTIKRWNFRMGDVNQTTQNLQVVKVDAERGLIAVRGAVPGAPGGDVIVRPTSKGV